VTAAAQRTAPNAVEGAARIGRTLAAAAIRHGGRCTWVADELVPIDNTWTRQARTIGPDLGTGNAGIGWFLARLSGAVEDDGLAVVAVEALRTGIDAIDLLLSGDRLGYYDGALGVAWAAVDAGRTIDRGDVVEIGLRAAESIVERSVKSGRSSSPTLFGGDAGVMTGLLAVAELVDEPLLVEAAGALSGDLARLAANLSEHALRGAPPWSTDGRSYVGLAEGASGLAVPLLAFGRATGDSAALDAAAEAALAERAWFATPEKWLGSPFHPWLDAASAACSLCSGAAGIGQARLSAYEVTGDLRELADVAAAIEVVRGGLAGPHGPDTSLCHGLSGWLDLLLSAGVVLDEQIHLYAAARVGEELLWLTDSGDSRSLVDNPSLLLGAAGVGLALLRLDDPAGVPSVTHPFRTGCGLLRRQ